MQKTPIVVQLNGEVVDVAHKVVVVRVPDLNEVQDTDYMAAMLKRAGAAVVLIADQSAKVEALDDAALKDLGLQRLTSKA